MRPIKFRGKRLDEGGWIYGDLCNYICRDSREAKPCIHLAHEDILCNGFYDIDPSTIGQFTGLTDCNGKEIYEGDIVKISVTPTVETAEANARNADLAGIKIPAWLDGGDIIARVSFFDCAFHFIHIKSYLPSCGKNTQEPMLCYLFEERHPEYEQHYKQSIEVIGNIHDNFPN